MQYVTRKDDISVLSMSVRLSNCLRRTGIHTIGAMLDYPEDHEWLSINNMGAKTLDEVTGIIRQLLNRQGDYILVEEGESVPVIAPEPEQQMIDADISLSATELPARALNVLIPEGITKMSQLVQMPDRKITSIQGIGDRTCRDIFDTAARAVDKALTAYRASIEFVHQEQQLPLSITNDLVTLLHGNSRCCLREVMYVKKTYPEAVGESFFYRLYETPYVQGLLKDTVISILEANEEGISRKQLSDRLPAHLGNTTIIEELLIGLEGADMAVCGEIMLKRKYPSIMRYARRLEDERHKTILLGRLTGRTLEDIGQELGLTRERVRQLLNKQLVKIRQQKLRFHEDRYWPVFSKYEFSLDEFQMAFDEAESTYNYLELAYESTAKKPLEEILNDDTISPIIRKQCERVIYRDYVTVDGVRVKRDRPSLCHYFVRTYCTEITAYDDFMLVYHEWLEELGLHENESLVIEARTYENKLNGADYVLWNQWRRFRYYNIASRDYDLLLTTLYIEQYADTEISTLKLFREYPELMEEYDIRDEYELHNLLKKIWPSGKATVDFRKMPTIEIGTVNRNNQVLELLLQYAPISIDDLAQRYEETYGVKANTVKGTYLRDFDEYYFEGMYSIDANNLPYEQFTHMQSVLTKDYYTIAKVKQLYLQEFPEADSSQINPYTLKTLGFHVYSGYAGYVIKNTFASAIEYFKHLLTHDDIVDAREFEKSIFYCGIYSGELGRLRNNREIVEFAPYKYINMRRLNQFGVTQNVLQEYCSAVCAFVEQGEIFSITALREDGFSHPLDDLGFEEWFYGSILLEDREHFSYQKIGGSRLLMRGKESHLLDILLTRIVGQNGKMDYYELCEMLEEHYGLRIPRDKIMTSINDAGLYYDRIMEAVYIDYETYFEEV